MAWIECRGVQRNQPSFAATDDPDWYGKSVRGLGLAGLLLLQQRVESGDDLRHFVTDQGASHFERLAIDPFAMRLIRKPLQTFAPGPGFLPIDQHRHEHKRAGCRRAMRFVHHFR